MLFTDIIGFLKGNVTVEAEGDFLERFLNVCMRRGIFLSDINRVSKRTLNAKMGIGGFRKIRPIAKKTRTKVRIKRRAGMPFLLNRYKKRRFALVGVAMFFGVLWYLSSHLMGIDVVGNERIKTADIESELKNFGVYRGVAVSKIDGKLVQNKMMVAFDDIAWIGVNIKGSRAYIEVKERLDTKQNLDKDVPCNIVAARDGMIKELVVRNGQTMVAQNHMVEKGDLLVSGVVDSGVWGIRWQHSDGEIFAETRYEISGKYPLEYEEKIFSGNKKTRHSLRAFGLDIPLHFGKAQPFEYCEKEEETKSYSFISPKVLSVSVTKEAFLEYTPKKCTRTEEDAAKLGKEELFKELSRQLGDKAKVLKKDATYKVISPKMVEVTATFVCLEDIAQKTPIESIKGEDESI